MPRINPINPGSATGRAKELFEGPLKGKAFNIYTTLAHAPAALDALVAMGGALANSELSPAQREVVQLAVASANNCAYCQAAHTVVGTMSGLTEAQAVGARTGTIDDDPKLDAIAKFALALHEKRGWVSDEDVAAFKSAGFTDTHLIETIAVYAQATFTNFFNHANETIVDFPEPAAV